METFLSTTRLRSLFYIFYMFRFSIRALGTSAVEA